MRGCKLFPFAMTSYVANVVDMNGFRSFFRVTVFDIASNANIACN